MELQQEPLYVGISKDNGKAVTGFGWCYSDYTDAQLKELGQSEQDVFLYNRDGIIVCLSNSLVRID